MTNWEHLVQSVIHVTNTKWRPLTRNFRRLPTCVSLEILTVIRRLWKFTLFTKSCTKSSIIRTCTHPAPLSTSCLPNILFPYKHSRLSGLRHFHSLNETSGFRRDVVGVYVLLGCYLHRISNVSGPCHLFFDDHHIILPTPFLLLTFTVGLQVISSGSSTLLIPVIRFVHSILLCVSCP